MKSILGLLAILLISTFSFADTVYVRKSVTENGVSASEGEKVRDVVRQAVSAQGHQVMSTPGKANWALRATVGKSDQGPYTVKVERFHQGQLIGSNHGSDVKVEEAARLATTNLIEALAKTLPEKTTATHVVTPVMASSTPTAEPRDVAANNEPSPIAHEAAHPNNIKSYTIAIGPVVANSLVGTNGTKFAITLGYNLGLSEHFNLVIQVDNNFNTGSVGGTAIQVPGAGIKYFLNDRISEFSPYAMIDLGFGGGDRGNDATGEVGGTIGAEVYRTQAATYSIYLRNFTMLTNNGSSLSNYPNVTQFMLGINF